ncbi:HNH endonuclease [TM7 phage DolZOral124_53_65]|nr:HNH endonuclease [TM7 phage DolZOral124_53_65]
MSQQRACKDCGETFTAYTTLQSRCRKCTYSRTKPITRRGKKTKRYEKWCDLVARPHLIRTQGNMCQNCLRSAIKYHDYAGNLVEETLDVAHIKSRGSSPSTRMDVKNVRLLCRVCHRLETDGKL